MFNKRKVSLALMAISLTLFAAGCKKKVVAPPPPPPPPPAAPTVVQFTAEPTSIQRGQASTLRWEVSGNVSGVSINQNIGTVQNTGSQRVTPSDSTTYTLTASGPGGKAAAAARRMAITFAPPSAGGRARHG